MRGTPVLRRLTAVAAAAALPVGLVQGWPTAATPERLFAAPVAYVAGDRPVSQVAAGDLNGDGAADLVATHYNSAPLSVLLSDGRGGYRRWAAADVDSTVGRPSLADIDRDGDLDVLLPQRPGPLLYVLGNDGRGRLRATSHHVAHRSDRYPFGAMYGSPAVVDVDGDGLSDLVGASHALVVVERAASGWRPARTTQLPGAFRERPMVIGDVDGDSDPDAVVGPSQDGRVLVLRNDGSGAYGEARAYGTGTGRPAPTPACRDGVCGLALDPAGWEWRHLAAADVDRDGDLDLVVASSKTPGLTVLPGDGRGRFGAPVRVAPGLRDVRKVVAADVDADRIPDLVALVGGNTVAVAPGRGDGRYRPAVPYDLGTGDAREVLVADLDGDGAPDLAAADPFRKAVLVLHNTLPRKR